MDISGSGSGSNRPRQGFLIRDRRKSTNPLFPALNNKSSTIVPWMHYFLLDHNSFETESLGSIAFQLSSPPMVQARIGIGPSHLQWLVESLLQLRKVFCINKDRRRSGDLVPGYNCLSTCRRQFVMLCNKRAYQTLCAVKFLLSHRIIYRFREKGPTFIIL